MTGSITSDRGSERANGLTTQVREKTAISLIALFSLHRAGVGLNATSGDPVNCGNFVYLSCWRGNSNKTIRFYLPQYS